MNLSLAKLGDDHTNPIRFCLKVATGSQRVINYFETNLQNLLREDSVDLTGKMNRHSSLRISWCTKCQAPGFPDYLRSGVQISMAAAIDYTLSNGAAEDPISLHYIGKDEPNHYEYAIGQVGDIIQQYDENKNFPVWGFGGYWKDNKKKEVSHCFALNGNN